MIPTSEQQFSTGSAPVRPSRYWYLVAGALLAAAVACLTVAVLGIFSWDRQIQDFQRVPAPGNGEVRLTQPGGYVIYIETRGACCSWTVGSQAGPSAGWSMRLAMEPVAGGQPARVGNWSGTPVSYGVGGHQGFTALSVTITQPGTYRIETSDVRPASVTDLAVGRNIMGATLLPLAPLGGGLVALLGAVVAGIVTAVRRRNARRGVMAPPDVTGPGPWPPAGGAPGTAAPLLVEFAGPARQERATVLFRAILAIPTLICLYFVRYVAGVILVTGWFGALFTGRAPDYAVSFLGGFQRWEVRTYAYLLLLTDKYPPFGFLDADYPVSVTASPGRLSRAAVLFRLVLIFPAWVVTTVLWYGLGPILMIPTWLIVLIRGRMPQPLYEAIAASLRYWARMKAYWYLLTGVYPDGLFGDQAEPAPGVAGPVFGAAAPAATSAPPATGPDFGAAAPAATRVPPAAGRGAAWAMPDVSGRQQPYPGPEPPYPGPEPYPSPEPPYPGPAPADQPIPLPADAVVGAGAAAAVPGRLVLSRQGKRLLGLVLGIGAATLVVPFVLVFALAAQPTPGGSGPRSVAAAAAGTPAASPASAPSSTPSARHGTAEWLKGLSSLNTAMNHAMGAGNQVVTSVSLRSAARQLGRCSAELSALGPPGAQLRQVHRLAVRACQGFEQGARYFAAAARFMSPDGAATDQAKVNTLLDRGSAGVNRGNNLISIAIADGSFIAPPG